MLLQGQNSRVFVLGDFRNFRRHYLIRHEAHQEILVRRNQSNSPGHSMLASRIRVCLMCERVLEGASGLLYCVSPTTPRT